jgi:Uma2 family endonuclease
LPPHLDVSVASVGIGMSGGKTCLVPDLIVYEVAAIALRRLVLEPTDARLLVEVLSPGNRRWDMVVKRREFARAGIPNYWIVDGRARELTAYVLDRGQSEYRLAAVVPAGKTWLVEQPFPVEIDPAEFC